MSHCARPLLAFCHSLSQPQSHSVSYSSQGPIVLGRRQKALGKNHSADFNPDFVFTEKEGTYDGSWALADVMSQLKKKVRLTVMDSSRLRAIKIGVWVSGPSPDLTDHLFTFSRYYNSFENNWLKKKQKKISGILLMRWAQGSQMTRCLFFFF